MTVKDTVIWSLVHYPTIYDNKFDVFHHLFQVCGNGYKWHNGELVDCCETHSMDEETLSKVTDDILHRAEDFTPRTNYYVQNITGRRETAENLVRLLKENMKKTEAGTEYVNHLIEKYGSLEAYKEYLINTPNKHILLSPFVLYPLDSHSKVVNYPSNINEDWGKARKEWFDYLVSVGEIDENYEITVFDEK